MYFKFLLYDEAMNSITVLEWEQTQHSQATFYKDTSSYDIFLIPQPRGFNVSETRCGGNSRGRKGKELKYPEVHWCE